MTAMALPRVMRPAPMKARTRRETAELLCKIDVLMMPVINPFRREPV